MTTSATMIFIKGALDRGLIYTNLWYPYLCIGKVLSIWVVKYLIIYHLLLRNHMSYQINLNYFLKTFFIQILFIH
jgi:hypothetical protein